MLSGVGRAGRADLGEGVRVRGDTGSGDGGSWSRVGGVLLACLGDGAQEGDGGGGGVSARWGWRWEWRSDDGKCASGVRSRSHLQSEFP